MATLEFKPPQSPEPELNLLPPKEQEQSLFSSLVENFRDTFFPQKLPPLVLTSKPIPVRDIWGFYGYKKSSATISLIAHIAGLAAILAISAYFAKPIAEKARQVVQLVAPSEIPVMKPAPKPVAGGGGG